MSHRYHAVVVTCAVSVALAFACGCSRSQAKSNCASGAVQAVRGTRHIDLLSCAAVATGSPTVELHRGGALAISGFHGAQVRLHSTSDIVSVEDDRIVALRPGVTRITQAGWPCADGRSRCTLLTLVVSRR